MAEANEQEQASDERESSTNYGGLVKEAQVENPDAGRVEMPDAQVMANDAKRQLDRAEDARRRIGQREELNEISQQQGDGYHAVTGELGIAHDKRVADSAEAKAKDILSRDKPRSWWRRLF